MGNETDNNNDVAVSTATTTTTTTTAATNNEDVNVKTSIKDKNVAETKTEDTKQDPTEADTKESTQTKNQLQTESKTDEKKETTKTKEEAEIDAALELERAKLKEKLEQRKRKLRWILDTCSAIDFLLAAMLMAPPKSEDYIYWKTTMLHMFLNPFYFIMRLFDSTHDSLDSAFIIIFRVVCLWKFTQLSVKWGHADTHTKIKSNKQSRIDWENSGLYKFGQFIMGCIDTLVKQSVIKPEKSDKLAELREQLRQQRENTGGDSGITTKFMDATYNELLQTYSLSQIVSNISDYDEQDTADFWKNTIWVLLFLVISLFQSFIGIKIVFYQRCTVYYIGIYTFNILLSHFELYFTKYYIDACTEPDNKFMVESLHSHPLFLRRVPGHYCDLCRKRITDKAYRCAKCDFDICKSCWKNKEKARLAAENQIRNDSTKDNKSMAELDKPVSLYEYFARLLQFHVPYIQSFGLGLFLLFLQSIISLSQSSKKGYLFDNVINKDMKAFYAGIEYYVILTVINGIVQTLQSFLMGRVNEAIRNDVQKELFHKTLSQDMVFYDGATTNNLIERCSWGLDRMMAPFQDSIKTIIRSGTNIVGGMIMCWTISFRLTLLGLSTLGPIAYLSILFRQWWRQNLRQTWKLHSEVRHLTSESFHNIKTIRSFSKEPSIIAHYRDLRDELHNHSIKSSVMNSLTMTVMNWFGLAGSTLITWAGGVIVFLSLMENEEGNNNNAINDGSDGYSSYFLNDTLTLGQLMAFELYWNRFKGDVQSLRRLFGRFEDAKFKARQIFRTLDAKPSIELLDGRDSNEYKDVKEVAGDICFNNVHFTYQLEPNKEILKGVNLKIPKGKTTAFVGRSGGGKTTIISLLLRLYDPTDGSITINDTKTGKIINDIRDYNVYSWRNVVALVSQETELFGSRSMAHNIGFGKDAYDKQELLYASSLANSHEFIMSFDDKYDARIGDRGCKLSGGQKQRISIARMLMKKPSLMLLDEATSALDAESEALVQAALEQAMQDTQCTVILVAHRLSTVVNSDQICVINDGTVAESGTHDELLEMKGVYAKLVDRQVNLKQTMKHKVKEMKNGNKNDSPKKVNDLDTIDALLDEINKKKETDNKNNATNIEETKNDEK